MLLKTEDKKDIELSFRPVADPTEIINEKTDKKRHNNYYISLYGNGRNYNL